MKTIEQIKRKLKKEQARMDFYNSPALYKNATEEKKQEYYLRLDEAWGKVQMLHWMLRK